MTAPGILVVVQDPGAASVLAPVVRRLATSGPYVPHCLAASDAHKLWRGLEIPSTKLSDDMAASAIEDILRAHRPRVVLTGTSPRRLERAFVAAASARGIPSVSIIDGWSNLGARFSNQRGQMVLPDRIAVIDDLAYAELIRDGVDAVRLVVTGSPALAEVARSAARFDSHCLQQLRASLGVGATGLLVAFVSQPWTLMTGGDLRHPLYPGYTEESVLSMVAHALVEVAAANSVKVTLAVRPHPRQDPSTIELPNIGDVVVAQDGSSLALIMAADLVVGMTSMLLVEACYLGCVTLSVQPGLQGRDALPTNASGLSRLVHRPEDLARVLEQCLLDSGTRSQMKAKVQALQYDVSATDNVIGVITELDQARERQA